ncbi:MAG: TIGR01777 family oxidoreductase [Acidimicrobiia bacterium]
MDIAVTGSSGLVGSALVPALTAAGHRVVKVVRHQPPGDGNLFWDPAAGKVDAGGFEGLDGVVHLAGVGVGEKPWTKKQKAAIRDSRIQGTTLLAETLAHLQKPPRVLLSASAVGIYGDPGDAVVTESAEPGTGFLAGLCREWEAATGPAEAAGIRVTHLRSGMVLAQQGGALKKMLRPFKVGLGGRLGRGRQWMSWVNLADEVGAIVHLLGDGAPAGPVNVTAPNPVTNAVFTAVLGRILRRPTLFPIPAFAVRVGLGKEMADEMILVSQRVVPERLLSSGYAFQAEKITTALEQVLGKPYRPVTRKGAHTDSDAAP